MNFSPKIKSIIIMVLVIFVFVGINLSDFSKSIKNTFYFVSFPIQKVFWKTGHSISNFFEAIFEIKNLKQNNQELKFKNQELIGEIIVLKNLRKENEKLRQALNIGLENDFKLVLSEVIGKDVSQDSILINKGAKDNISKNMAVITEQRVLVGRIGEVYKDFSEVVLISNKNSSFDIEIQNKNKILGIIKGKGGSELLIEFIPQEEEIKKQDIIITSSLGNIFPKGLLVGSIKEVKRSDVRAFQQAEVSPFFNIKNLKMLFVIADF